ncbi:polysaccharide transporter, PST family [Clostridium cavendishii DSM 21758]|uniref:Polysaccharide transporter, PST family n=1 Tax=Clostridium cavendishii DSM 21758 TaxID=1121302 RepID=A0A1M6QD61_9CLOT|nr:oligosaccharide flippase family protein [Clostridium cavendishii]SHK18244.1 polysaccharide transporter, PST family [Clostridium cavendishii DSM 21758]
MKKNKEIKTLFSNTIMLYIMQISGYIFPLLTFPYLTRVLGPEKYGIVVFVNATMVYFQMSVDFGFLLSATKECSLYRNNKKKLGKILTSVIQSKLILWLFGLIIIMLLISNIKIFKDKELFLLLSYIPIALSIFIPDFLFRGLEEMEKITMTTIISRALYTVSIFIFVKNSEQYIYIPILTAVSNIAVIIIMWIIIFKKLKIKVNLSTINECIIVLKESSIFFLSRIASTIYGASNTFILGFNYNNSALAQFGSANSLIGSVKSLISPIADSLYPYMIKQKNYKFIKKIIIILTPLICIGVLILYIFAKPIVLLLCGKEYVQAVPIFRVMLPMVVIALPSYILGFPVLGAMGKVKEANMSVVYASIFHIIGLVFLMFINKLTFIIISILTCITETIVLILRVFYIIKAKNNREIVNIYEELSEKSI